jgi:integrase
MPAAEAVAKTLIGTGRSEEVHGPRLVDCVRRYVESRDHELSSKTKGQHELHLGRLVEYAQSRGAYFMSELTVDLLENFKIDGLNGLANTSKATAFSKVTAFLREAFRRGWIATHLAEQVRPHRASYDQKDPFSEDEVTLLLDESLKLKGGTHGYARHPGTFRLLLEIMLETGLRVGDAVVFDPTYLMKGEALWVYSYQPQKQRKAERQKSLEVFLSERLKLAIEAAHEKGEWLSPRLPFHFGSSRNPSYLASEVYERMRTIGKRCGVSDCRPHRLRDTFAVRCLLRGLSLDDLSRLLGHSSTKVTELHYAKWVPARRKRLERLLAETFVDPPGNVLGNA